MLRATGTGVEEMSKGKGGTKVKYYNVYTFYFSVS